ncbi:MAG: ABC transporter substrate-binding protein [Deltaproteobacteria bacterium]|nr:ABC transporter substrate-binding protein [Deltaproteobacteria bacterium]
MAAECARWILRKTAAALICAAAAFWTSGCTPAAVERDPGCINVRLKKNPATIDPARIVDLDSARIAAKLFNGLITFDDELQPRPDLARSWTLSADGRIYRFELRDDAFFFNGRAVSAHDVVFSFERVLAPQTRSPRTWVLARIQGADAFMQGRAERVTGLRAVSDRMLEIELTEPFAPFLSMLGLTAAYVVPREEVERLGEEFGRQAGGSGPFMLADWKHNQYVQLRKNPNWHGPAPLSSGICYRIIPEDFTAMVAFEKGSLDILPDIMASEYARYTRDPVWREGVQQAPGLNTYYLGLNCGRAPFSDARVRQALNCAIDRQTMLAAILDGRGQIASGPVPPLLRRGAAPEGYEYDPQRARALLAEAGYPDGFAMRIYQTADSENLDMCQAVQAYLQAVGIRASIVQLEWSTFLAAVADGEADAFWLSWWADYPDAENFLYPLFHSANFGSGGNRSRYSDAEFDRLIEQAVTAQDSIRRDELYAQCERMIAEQAPWVFFWHKDACSIHRPELHGYRTVPLTVMEKGLSWQRRDGSAGARN